MASLMFDWIILYQKICNHLYVVYLQNSVSNGFGEVGRAVAFDAIDPQFKSSHWQFYLLSNVLKR